MLRIRLARRGRRNLNSFAIVVAEQKFRRDGRFVEKIGYYQPLLKNEDPFRLKIEKERYDYWVSQGAQPTDKIKFLAGKAGIAEVMTKEFSGNKKSKPKAKAQERMKASQEAELAAQEAARQAAQASASTVESAE